MPLRRDDELISAVLFDNVVNGRKTSEDFAAGTDLAVRNGADIFTADITVDIVGWTCALNLPSNLRIFLYYHGRTA